MPSLLVCKKQFKERNAEESMVGESYHFCSGFTNEYLLQGEIEKFPLAPYKTSLLEKKSQFITELSKST